jgi:hypothetical protein
MQTKIGKTTLRLVTGDIAEQDTEECNDWTFGHPR